MNITELTINRISGTGVTYTGDDRFSILRSQNGDWDQLDAIGQTFEGSQSGLIASALSLVTNAVATLLVTYKTWCVLLMNHVSSRL